MIAGGVASAPAARAGAGGRATARAGVTLPELVLVAWLFALVLLVTARFATAQGRLAATTHDRVRAAELVRTADVVLGRELRYSGPADRRVSADSVRLRAVRGGGAVCAGAGSELRIRYRGVRRPDPEKDSVLLVSAERTAGSAHAITAASADHACNGYRLTLDPPAAGPVGLALVFETGSYHLSGGALRYRRGRGGRQPVTEAVLREAAFEPGPAGLALLLALDPDSLPRAAGWRPRAGVRLLNPLRP